MNGRRLPWPLVLIATPAAAAIWSGWVGLGGLCGFGPVNLLPGIGGGFTINTAITLPVGVEAYAAYALGAWMSPHSPERARRFAMWSALGALAYGMLGQVAYHLLAAAGVTVAPWPVVVAVSCMPVAVLGFAAALTHLLRSGEDVAGEPFLAGVSTGSPATQLLPPEFTDKASAAEVAYRRSVTGGNPFKPYALATRFEIPRPLASQIVERVNAEIPKDSPAGPDSLPAGAQDSPAGNTGTAGDSGRDAGSPPGVPAVPASNGQAHG